MKRLAMAATFALALSLGGLSPAVAQADDSSATETTDIQAAGDAGNAEADTPGTENPPTDPGEDAGDDGTPTEPGDGEQSTDPGGDEDAADPGDSDESTDPDEGSDEPTEDSTPIDASFSLDQSTMPVDEAAKAIPYTITGLKAGDTVTAEPGENGSITVDSDGTFAGDLRGNTELKVGDVVDVTVTVARDGQESKTFTGSVEITENDDGSEAAVSVDPQSQGIDSYLDNGVDITVNGCEAGEDVTVTIVRKGDDTNIWEETKTAGDDGSVSTSFMPGTGGDGWIDDFVVSATCGDTNVETTYSVTEDDDGADADLTVTPKIQKLHDFLENGVNMTLVNCHVDSDVTFRVSTKRDPDTEVWKETQKAGEDAAGSVQFTPEEGGAGWADDFLVMASCGDKSAETTFTVTDDGSVVDPKLSIDPERISGVDFIDRDKGVQMTITDCAADAEVHFEVYSGDEKLYEQTATADEDGAAGIQVYGLGDDPAYYVGSYKVVADCMDVSRSGEFVVTGGESGGGDGGDSGEAGSTGGGSSMPRTGAELTGLTAGALLILGGGAAIALARRKNKN
ncbi:MULTISPECIES: LPXTG cell wall anchor domain-containing protein [unclassified Brevibacterium]|uniref:LPXTG cell wall anchor domain-containing protein n=1 Tax=unclassified Brevibacterium TaxID=2614124 RepID=UPI001092D57F|nr:LPXTG cell wall anchor domain-containing protein [Brevibacterium sp. S22]